LRYELQIALRYLRSRRRDAFISVTTLFTAIGVTIGVAALIITLSVMNGFQESLRSRVLALSPQVQVVSSEGSITNYHALQEKIAPVPKIGGTDAFVVGQAMLSSGRAVSGVIVRGVEPENPTVLSQWSRYMIDGAFHDLVAPPVPSGTSLNPVAIGVTLASKLKVKRGDRVRMVAPILAGTSESSITTKTAEFKVGAIFDSGMNFLDSNMVFIDLGTAQTFFGRPGKVDGIDIHLTSLDATDEVTSALRRLLARPYSVRNWIEFNQSASAGFAVLKKVYALVLMLLIGVAAFNLIATLIMVVMEKRKDIAVLMAMGAKPREVRLVFVLKGLIVGGVGTVMGALLGVVGCEALARYHFIHIPREIYGISTLPISVDPVSFVWVCAASVALCLLATIYPARQASHQMPVELFRT